LKKKAIWINEVGFIKENNVELRLCWLKSRGNGKGFKPKQNLVRDE
jgi:hypothetical protein